jgi:purine-binding chemotaxis protein CheW
VDEPVVKIVVFTLSGELFAFPGRNVMEILPAEGISPIPGAPDHIPGLITVRGEIESVIDLRRILGLEGRRQDPGRILLAAGSSIRSGVLIDTVEDVVDVPGSSILPAPRNLDRGSGEFVAGQLDRQGRSVTLLDPDRILARASVP